MDPITTQSMSRPHRTADVNDLILNILTFAHATDCQPCIMDFMNYVRRYKIDTRHLALALVRAEEYIAEKSAGSPKIIVTKNPEGSDLQVADHDSMRAHTKAHGNTVILHAVWTGMVLLDGETFTQMKNRARLHEKEKYCMYARDDAVILTMYWWLRDSGKAPVIWSEDRFSDTGKYKHMAPFKVYMFARGEMYKFDFEYVRIHHMLDVSGRMRALPERN